MNRTPSLLPAEECLLIEMNNQDIAKKMVLLFSRKGGCLILQEVQIDFRHFFQEEICFFTYFWIQKPICKIILTLLTFRK